MHLDSLTIAGMVAVLFTAGVIQSGVGFAYALFATPILVWMGQPLPETVALVSVCSFAQTTLGATHLRHAIPWREASTAIVVRLAGTAAGILVLRQLVGRNTADIQFVVGLVLCVLVAAILADRARPAAHLHWAWGALAFTGSGLLSGITGMGGPPLALWAVAHDWPTARIRGFLFTTFGATIPLQIVMFYTAFGAPILRSAGLALMLSPVVLAGALVGLTLGHRLPPRVLRWIVHGLLLAIGLGSVLPRLLRAV